MAETLIFRPGEAVEYPYMAAVENYLGGIGRAVYPDGTLQFMDRDVTPPVAYSPRLSQVKLEQFCKDHLDQYERFYHDNKTAIKNYEPIPAITPFWKPETTQGKIGG